MAKSMTLEYMIKACELRAKIEGIKPSAVFRKAHGKANGIMWQKIVDGKMDMNTATVERVFDYCQSPLPEPVTIH
jgi:hypothetical protein